MDETAFFVPGFPGMVDASYKPGIGDPVTTRVHLFSERELYPGEGSAGGNIAFRAAGLTSIFTGVRKRDRMTIDAQDYVITDFHHLPEGITDLYLDEDRR